MNVGSKSERRWRTKGRRGVSPIIATILLVAITVVLAAVLYILISGLTKGPGNTPLGTALAVGSPSEASNVAANHWYNFSIQSAGGGLTLSSTNYQFQTATGSIVAPSGTWTLSVLGLSGTPIGAYSLTTGAWTSGGATPMTSQMTISVYSAGTVLSGDTMVVSGTGSFSGTIAVGIP